MQFGLLVTEVLGFRACWQESSWSFRAGGQSVVGIASFLASPVRKFVLGRGDVGSGRWSTWGRLSFVRASQP